MLKNQLFIYTNKTSKGTLGIVQMSHKSVHYLYFLDTNQTHLKEVTSMAAHDPYQVIKVVFFHNEDHTLTIMHTLTSGNTIAIMAFRCFLIIIALRINLQRDTSSERTRQD